MSQLTVILPEEQTEQIMLQVHNIINKAIEDARNAAGLDKPFLKQTHMIQYLGISYKTFKLWKARGLPVIMLDGVELYSKDQVKAWLESQSL